MWASHHLWHENISFIKLADANLVNAMLAEHGGTVFFISMCLLLAACAKSAQFPFSSWVPRAMEGPTPSSAIFYGSLSIHFGVFLLIRTMPFWEQQFTARVIIGLVGLITALFGYFTARVQPSIKPQIAYASVSQIGIMFIELAFSLETIAVLHFIGNAFLRTYQLLISPSVVSYLIREQFYYYRAPEPEKDFIVGKKWHYTIYMLSLREFGLDTFMSKIVFGPFKKIGNKMSFITFKNILFYFIPSYFAGILLYVFQAYFPPLLHTIWSLIFGLSACLMILRAFSERKNPRLAWLLVFLSHFWIALSVIHNEQFNWFELVWYLSGVILAGGTGYWALTWLKKRESNFFSLYRYHGHAYEYPVLAKIFFVSTLGLMGFPITTTFIGEDLIFGHIQQNDYLLAFFLSASFVIGGIALIRIYARIFLGPHIKTYHETPLQSS
jgi:NADH:ubiquinone oxidoreductase subunit 2 (subunit N)